MLGRAISRRIQRYNSAFLDEVVSYLPMDEIELSVARVYQEARTNENSYFEKLALLDGATVALVVTAVLSPLHGVLKHKITLGVGLTFLVSSMLALLLRNYLAVEEEFFRAARATMDREYLQNAKKWERSAALNKWTHCLEKVGLVLTGIGMFVLLAEVWFILST